MKAIVLVSYLANEEENALVKPQVGILKFMVEFIADALKTKNHQATRNFNSFSAEELLEGFSNIPRCSDSNVPTMLQAGALPLLSKVRIYSCLNFEPDA